jgi:hypothetical protein
VTTQERITALREGLEAAHLKLRQIQDGDGLTAGTLREMAGTGVAEAQQVLTQTDPSGAKACPYCGSEAVTEGELYRVCHTCASEWTFGRGESER